MLTIATPGMNCSTEKFVVSPLSTQIAATDFGRAATISLTITRVWWPNPINENTRLCV